MVKVQIPKHIFKAIEKHAIEFKGREIYGWLLGYDDGINLKVIASVPCKMYKIQNEVRAEPSTEEAFEIVKNIPKGIGIIGIYHSHPNKVYHSVTDDLTVKQYANMYPHFLSIVTNGKETKSFQLIGNDVEPITADELKEETLKKLSFKLHLKYYYAEEELSLAYISSEIREFLEKEVSNLKLVINGREIKEKEKIDSLTKSLIEIKLNNTDVNYAEERKSVLFNFNFDMVSPPKRIIADLKPLLFNGIKDSMYYYIKNIKIANTFKLPYEFKFEISNIPWRFNVKKETWALIQFFDIFAFRIQFMSFKNERKRNKIHSEITKIKELLEKDKSAIEKIDLLLEELTKKI
ncbi:MAG: Mov34/MPN/PAD-1 family protein [Candidatus Heimdallarchaeum endolithica]|uniref:Mov34/MPN/PAD-1 family protein n=1 Tax=Candidatus Heimdallarchaeum endolithica TaxID=2876572 RepID=A0A9Y1BRV7_9ARCH|nr:MAG: Mov34/MPN/PAD-1 family protein [Candidatus Heimdallarchaeum endolithica]